MRKRVTYRGKGLGMDTSTVAFIIFAGIVLILVIVVEKREKKDWNIRLDAISSVIKTTPARIEMTDCFSGLEIYYVEWLDGQTIKDAHIAYNPKEGRAFYVKDERRKQREASRKKVRKPWLKPGYCR